MAEFCGGHSRSVAGCGLSGIAQCAGVYPTGPGEPETGDHQSSDRQRVHGIVLLADDLRVHRIFPADFFSGKQNHPVHLRFLLLALCRAHAFDDAAAGFSGTLGDTKPD